MTPAIAVAGEADLDDLLALMRAYCDFYEVAPADEALLALSRALIADPEREGVQLLARDEDGAAVGFATVFWTWISVSIIAFLVGVAILPVSRSVRWWIVLLAGVSFPFVYAVKLGQVGPVLFLASPLSNYVHGQILNVTGGQFGGMAQ